VLNTTRTAPSRCLHIGGRVRYPRSKCLAGHIGLEGRHRDCESHPGGRCPGGATLWATRAVWGETRVYLSSLSSSLGPLWLLRVVVCCRSMGG
jgi:hypothetical protein